MSAQERAEAIRKRMIELEIEAEAQKELRLQRAAERSRGYFGKDRFHNAPESVQPDFRPRRARYGLTIHCACGHRGQAIVRPGQRLRFRCSQCNELQEL